jgi:hypothetical protein
MTAHRFIETEAIFEDIDNRSVEVLPINLAHAAVKLAKNEAYHDILTFIQNKREIDASSSEFEIALNLIEDYIKRKIK